MIWTPRVTIPSWVLQADLKPIRASPAAFALIDVHEIFEAHLFSTFLPQARLKGDFANKPFRTPVKACFAA
jgi:hypothetical protein